VFGALEVFYENALYKFTFDIDIDIDIDNKHCMCDCVETSHGFQSLRSSLHCTQ